MIHIIQPYSHTNTSLWYYNDRVAAYVVRLSFSTARHSRILTLSLPPSLFLLPIPYSLMIVSNLFLIIMVIDYSFSLYDALPPTSSIIHSSLTLSYVSSPSGRSRSCHVICCTPFLDPDRQSLRVLPSLISGIPYDRCRAALDRVEPIVSDIFLVS